MPQLLLRGGRLVDPARDIDAAPADLLLAGGRVEAVGAGLDAGSAAVVDVRGLVVVPGLVDMHVHLREPGDEEAETVRSGTLAAARGGFTAIACMANTRPVNDSGEVTRRILERARADGKVRVYPIAALSRDLAGEDLADHAALRAAGAVGMSDDGRPVVKSALMRRALERGAELGMVVVDHCEDPTASPGWSMREGSVAQRLGERGMSAAAEEILVARDAILARDTSCPVHVAHLSSRGSVERVREEKRRGTRITAEVTPHHFSLTDRAVERLGTAAKMNPPLGGDDDVAAVLAGLRDGTIDCIASDHAPHSATAKARPFAAAPNGVIGLETTVAVALDRLVHAGVLGLARLVELLSVNPARLLGVPGGRLGPGDPADVTVLDLDRRVEVRPEAFASRSRNCPFAGLVLRGQAVMTIVGGEVVFDGRERGRHGEG